MNGTVEGPELTYLVCSLCDSELVLGDLVGRRLDFDAQDARVGGAQQRQGHQGRSVHRWVFRTGVASTPRADPNACVVCCVSGGWGGSYWFSQTMSTSANRTTFVNACVSAVNTYSLDGASASRVIYAYRN